MEPLVALAVIAVVLLLLVSPFLAVFALVRLHTATREIGDLREFLAAETPPPGPSSAVTRSSGTPR